jgi:hypothetical protein
MAERDKIERLREKIRNRSTEMYKTVSESEVWHVRQLIRAALALPLLLLFVTPIRVWFFAAKGPAVLRLLGAETLLCIAALIIIGIRENADRGGDGKAADGKWLLTESGLLRFLNNRFTREMLVLLFCLGLAASLPSFFCSLASDSEKIVFRVTFGFFLFMCLIALILASREGRKLRSCLDSFRRRTYLLVIGEVTGRHWESSSPSSEHDSDRYCLFVSVGSVKCDNEIVVSRKEYKSAWIGSKYYLLIVNKKIVSYFSANEFVSEVTANESSSA